jgi:hypothetical protein
MKLDTIYLQPDSVFSSYVADWAGKLDVEIVDYDVRSDEHSAEGLLLINENQDITRDLDDLHSLFDRRHVPTQKIDINGTLQVAISSFEMWLTNFKCKKILVLGSDNLVKNENLDRFFSRVNTKIKF